jgi:tryptophanyl-tRNA synthetase
LSDDSETLKDKIRMMYTDPNHIKVTDPGCVEGNMVFTYLDAFCDDSHFEKYLPEYKNFTVDFLNTKQRRSNKIQSFSAARVGDAG